MGRWTPQLAKLTRPRLHAALLRERLLTRLDKERRESAAIWINGPPGSGKTTLVASWIDARQQPALWYQLDGGDADLSTFFYYLGQAARAFARKSTKPLPLLTPEFLGDVQAFARRFFRELFARLPEHTVVVLDNYQEIAAEHRMHDTIVHAIEEVPRHIALLVISRQEPPDAFSRQVANRDVIRLDWDDLKLTREEALAVAAQSGFARENVLTEMYTRSEGWAAGFILLLESMRRGIDSVQATTAESMRDIFNYFARQLFDQANLRTQNALLQLSYLPNITARHAEEFGAGVRLLEDLHRRHLFTDRRPGNTEAVYQFHPLFRAFLRHLAGETLPRPTQVDTAIRAAALLEREGHGEEALPLYLEAGDRRAAIRIIQNESSRLIGLGRWRVVLDWIDRLPAEDIMADCWLLHWAGSAMIAVNPPQARKKLEQAFLVAVAAGDDLCQMATAAGVVETHVLEYTHFRPLDQWITVLETKLAQRPVFPDNDLELRVQSALLIAYTFRRPDSPGVLPCAENVFRLLDSDARNNLRVTGAAYLAAYGASTGPLEIARRATPVLDHMLGFPDVPVRTAGWCGFISAFAHMVMGNETQARDAVAALDALGAEHQLPSLTRLAAVIGTNVELGAGHSTVAASWLRKLGQAMVRGNPYDEASHEALTAWVGAHTGSATAAGEHVARAIKLYDDSGHHYTRCFSRVQHGMISLLADRTEEAEHWLHEALTLARATQAGWLEVEACTATAYLDLLRGSPEPARANLRRAFGLARQGGFIWPFRFLRPWMPIICEAALADEIEPEYVRHVITALALQPPSPHTERWPWRLMIHTLRGFRVLRDGQPIPLGRKTPKRLLQMLKAIVALGGRDVSLKRLADTLWAEEEGDAAFAACERALNRLRQLLGERDALLVQDASVSLNSQCVWVDLHAVEGILGHPGTAASAQRLLELYRSEFLAEDDDEPWALAVRHRLQYKVAHHLEHAGRQAESSGDWEQASALYHRGLDVDPCAEALYCGLMRCHVERGDRGQAKGVYTRMRDQLLNVRGVRPAAATEELARRLQLI